MTQMPVYVKIPHDIEIKDLLIQARQKIDSVKRSLENIQALSKEEEGKVNQWKENFNSMNQRVENVKSFLLEPEKI